MKKRILGAFAVLLIFFVISQIAPEIQASPEASFKPGGAAEAGLFGEAAAILAAGHERFNQGDFSGARMEYAKLQKRTGTPAVFRSLGLLCTAQAFEREGNHARARETYARLAQSEEAPPHHRQEAEQRLDEMARLAKGLPARDPLASRVQLPPLPPPGLILHLAPDGAETNDGSAGKPFGTLEQARDAIRQFKESGPLPPGGVAVLVQGGEYQVNATWSLDERDSGTETAPVVYRAADGESPRFRGGVRLRDFRPVTDEAILGRLPEESRDHVVEVDLRGAGITNLIALKLGGFASGHGFRTHPAHELFFDGKALQLARGPNQGFLRIQEVAVRDGTKGYDREGSKVGQFHYEGDRPAGWISEPGLLLYGYWFWDWADSYERVESIDTQRRLITLATPYHRYGYSVGAPFYAINALSELDQPGEWYFDHDGGRLFLYPPSDPNRATVEFSTFAEPMARLENVSHVRLQGITWELGSADAIQIRGGTNCLLAGVVARQFAGNAIEIRGGTGHGLLSCDIRSMGRGGVILSGGNRKTLAPSGHFVENCEIHELSRIDRTYTPAIHVSGVGHRIAHNRLHDIRSSALRVDGNDHLIEYNEIFHAAVESDDQGAADMWGDATFRGNVYRFNYWHHIGSEYGAGEQPKLGQAGIRLDDAICGTLIYGNVFYRSAGGKTGFGAVQIHGGKENIIDNNLFADCPSMVSFTAWNDQRWRDFVKDALAKPAIDQALYLERYPDLARLPENANRNHLWRNIGIRCRELTRRDPKRTELIDNFTTNKNGGWEPWVARPGFAPIPFGSIGLYQDEFRRETPPVPFPFIWPDHGK
jgi:hypothetical protein